MAKSLGARCVSREVLLEAAKTYNVPEDKISQVFERTPSFWERMTESRRTFLAYIQAILADWAKEDRLVYHGNAGQEMLREVPHVLRVRIDAPMAQRVRSACQALKIDAEPARRLIEQADDDRAKRLRYFFNADWKDISLYDLVINTEKLTLGDTRDLILHATKLPRFQLTPERREAFQDFLLKSRIYAMLASALVGRLSLVAVHVESGVVTLGGTLTSHESTLDQLVQQIQAIPGVKQVVDHLAALEQGADA